jgi:hypothetical protein
MNPALILNAIQAALAALPNLLALYDQAKSGQAVTEAQVTASLSAYDAARAQLVGDIAAEG